MPKRTAKQPRRPAKQPFHQNNPGRKRSASQVTSQSTITPGAKRRKTVARPLTTDDLPILIKEVCDNLRPRQDEGDSDKANQVGARRTTWQACQQQGGEEDSSRDKDRASSSSTTTSQQKKTAEVTTSQQPKGTKNCRTEKEDETIDGDPMVKKYNCICITEWLMSMRLISCFIGLSNPCALCYCHDHYA